MRFRFAVVLLVGGVAICPCGQAQTKHPAATSRAAKKGTAAPSVLADFAYPGEIRAFAGDRCPANWLPADGKEYSEAGHGALVAAIGDLWGSSGLGKFRVPDLQGMFLRGWNQGANGDPDAKDRTLPQGSPVDPNRKGDQVGSSQKDSLAQHHHTTTLTARWGDKYADTIGWGADNGQHPNGNFSNNTSEAGGSETRPRNVYVLFCIRDGK
jgi:microcystin-dependent protein